MVGVRREADPRIATGVSEFLANPAASPPLRQERCRSLFSDPRKRSGPSRLSPHRLRVTPIEFPTGEAPGRLSFGIKTKPEHPPVLSTRTERRSVKSSLARYFATTTALFAPTGENGCDLCKRTNLLPSAEEGCGNSGTYQWLR